MTALGMQGTADYKRAVNELQDAQCGLNFIQRMTIQSWMNNNSFWVAAPQFSQIVLRLKHLVGAWKEHNMQQWGCTESLFTELTAKITSFGMGAKAAAAAGGSSIIIITIIIIFLSFALLTSLLPLPLVAAQSQIRLEAVTEQGTFRVEIMWTPNNIGSPNTFDIHFIDPDTGSEIEDIKYDISIYRDDEPEIRRLDQISTVQQFSFGAQGSYEIRIDDIEDLGEGLTIPIQVTSEVQQHEAFVLTAAAMCIAVIGGATKSNRNDLFRQPIN
jgi:hypothetical protein